MASIFVRIAISAIVFLLFGVLAVHGPWGAARIESLLQSAARQKLDGAGFPWARAEVQDQVVLLSGEAPDEAARASAAALALTAIGPGGRTVGGVTRVNAGLISLRPPAPKLSPIAGYRFQAILQNGELAIAGNIPSNSARTALADTIAASNALGFTDATAVIPIADEAAWISTATATMHALLMLERGEIRQEGAAFSLTGLANGDAVADAAESLAAGAAGVYAFTVDIERPPPVPPVAVSASACQAAINRATNGRRLTFRPESAWLSEADRIFLDAFNKEVSVCGELTILIEGHTDSVGSAADNFELSERRAKAVETYLEKSGAAAAFDIRPYGETRPIASNKTRDGQRSNRRIDFFVAVTEAESH